MIHFGVFIGTLYLIYFVKHILCIVIVCCVFLLCTLRVFVECVLY